MTKNPSAGKRRAGKPRSYWYAQLEKKIETSGRLGLTQSKVLGSNKEPSFALKVEVVEELLAKGKIVYIVAKDWKKQSRSVRFLHRSALLLILGQVQDSAIDPAKLRGTYDQLVAASGFPAVRIIDLAKLGSFPIMILVQTLRDLHD